MRAVALLLSITMLGCFPHSAQNRRYSMYGEGAAIITGIALEGIVNSGADCDQMLAPGQSGDACHTKASVLGDVGLALILGGLLGFVATVSTAEEDKAPAPMIDIKATPPAEAGALKLPPGVQTPGASSTTGAAATSAATPAADTAPTPSPAAP